MTNRPPVRVMIVDPSAVARGFISRILETDPDVSVVATARTGEAAIPTLISVDVDVILLDATPPRVDVLTVLPKIMEARPNVPVLLTCQPTEDGAEIALKALSLGAADSIEKPSQDGSAASFAPISDQLVAKVRTLVNLPSAAVAEEPTRPTHNTETTRNAEPVEIKRVKQAVPTRVKVLAIGSNTGGPNALHMLLAGLGKDFALPILVVQHMPPLFTGLLAERLRLETGLDAREAVDGESLTAGRIYVAPGDYHMTVRAEPSEPCIRLSQAPPEHFCRPAVDPLFRSVAETFGNATLAVVLTGMGGDGKLGAEEINRAGGRVLVQDEATSTVWGIPGAIAKAGLAHGVVAIDKMAATVLRVTAVGQ